MPGILLGLLLRQAQMAADMARMVPLTMSPWAEMGQRAMTETLIRLKWLAGQDLAENYEWFVNYGLGQEKLHIEHLKVLLDNAERQYDHDDIEAQIKAREVSLANSHSWAFANSHAHAFENHYSEIQRRIEVPDERSVNQYEVDQLIIHARGGLRLSISCHVPKSVRGSHAAIGV